MLSRRAPWSLWLPLWIALVAGSFGEEEEERKAENVAGIIGESVTFQLNFSEPFKSITLQRKKKQNFNNVAILKLEKNYCAVTEIFFTSFEERLDVSEDCKRIKIFHLTQEDSATFRAEIPIPQKDEPLNLFFNLQVFRKLSDSDLQIHCKAIGNETWRLNCSAGESEEGVLFNMTADGNQEHSGRTLDVQDGGGEEDPNISCVARNPVSTASTARPLRDLCEPRTTAATIEPRLQNGNRIHSRIIIGVSILIVLIVIVVCAVVFYCAWRRKKAASHLQGHSAEPEECKSIYAQVGEVFQDRDVQSSRPRTGPKKEKQQASQTIYTTVEHPPKTSPLQTDDEKMQKRRRRRDEGEKTVYSEINKSSEGEAHGLKTVYETVKNPRPLKTQEYTLVL
nr:PREDICTED: SLAM family member 7-like [Anolis carolinensis]|eukprot:XP_008123820.1 PREDICTED: SLAM family member 7-like [Anolis carolinensis]